MRTQRLVIPVVAGIAVFGTVSAFAASLNLSSSKTLASGNADVLSCDATTLIDATYTTVFAAGGYAVNQVTLSSPVACEGKVVKVTFTDAGGASLGEVDGVVATGSTPIVVPTVAPILAAAVEGISVVIAG